MKCSAGSHEAKIKSHPEQIHRCAGEQVNDGLLHHGYSCIQAWPVDPIQLLLLVGPLSSHETVVEARVLQALEDCGHCGCRGQCCQSLGVPGGHVFLVFL